MRPAAGGAGGGTAGGGGMGMMAAARRWRWAAGVRWAAEEWRGQAPESVFYVQVGQRQVQGSAVRGDGADRPGSGPGLSGRAGKLADVDPGQGLRACRVRSSRVTKPEKGDAAVIVRR